MYVGKFVPDGVFQVALSRIPGRIDTVPQSVSFFFFFSCPSLVPASGNKAHSKSRSTPFPPPKLSIQFLSPETEIIGYVLKKLLFSCTECSKPLNTDNASHYRSPAIFITLLLKLFARPEFLTSICPRFGRESDETPEPDPFVSGNGSRTDPERPPRGRRRFHREHV